MKKYYFRHGFYNHKIIEILGTESHVRGRKSIPNLFGNYLNKKESTLHDIFSLILPLVIRNVVVCSNLPGFIVYTLF